VNYTSPTGCFRRYWRTLSKISHITSKSYKGLRGLTLFDKCLITATGKSCNNSLIPFQWQSGRGLPQSKTLRVHYTQTRIRHALQNASFFRFRFTGSGEATNRPRNIPRLSFGVELIAAMLFMKPISTTLLRK
jgi:hypothetical protein